MRLLSDPDAAPTYKITAVIPTGAATRSVHKPYVVLSLLQVLDVLTTGIILGVFVGAGREGNPFVASVFDHAGLVGGLAILLAVKLGAVGFMYWTQFPCRIANSIYGLVIVNNALILGLATWSVLT